MRNFDFFSPTYFCFGRNRETDTGKMVRKFGGSRVLVMYGGNTAVKSGLLGRVEASLKAKELRYFVMGGVRPNPESDLVYKAISTCKQENIDFILGVGGGSVLDSAKAVAVGALYPGDFWDFFDYAVRRPITEALPVGAVLTLAATGSEGSTDAVITRVDGKQKRTISSDLIRPKFSVLNPELTQTVPPYQTACGITDIMSHVFERYFTNTEHVELSDRMCEAVLCTMIEQAKIVMANPNDYAARANIMWAATIAHNNILGADREQDWGSHLIEHELSAMYGCAHGAGLAVVMPAWMKYVMNHDEERFAQLAVRVWGCNDGDTHHLALQGIRCYETFLRSVGMPTHLSELGGNEEDIPQLAVNVGFGPYQFGSFVKLGIPETEAILRLAL